MTIYFFQETVASRRNFKDTAQLHTWVCYFQWHVRRLQNLVHLSTLSLILEFDHLAMVFQIKKGRLVAKKYFSEK